MLLLSMFPQLRLISFEVIYIYAKNKLASNSGRQDPETNGLTHNLMWSRANIILLSHEASSAHQSEKQFLEIENAAGHLPLLETCCSEKAGCTLS